jgi:hypothetical protein
MNSSAVTKNVLKHVEERFLNLLQQVFYSRHRIYPVEIRKATKND